MGVLWGLAHAGSRITLVIRCHACAWTGFTGSSLGVADFGMDSTDAERMGSSRLARSRHIGDKVTSSGIAVGVTELPPGASGMALVRERAEILQDTTIDQEPQPVGSGHR